MINMNKNDASAKSKRPATSKVTPIWKIFLFQIIRLLTINIHMEYHEHLIISSQVIVQHSIIVLALWHHIFPSASLQITISLEWNKLFQNLKSSDSQFDRPVKKYQNIKKYFLALIFL